MAGEDGAIDVVLVAGWYHAISFLVRALRLDLGPGAPAFPDASSEAFETAAIVTEAARAAMRTLVT